MSLEAESSDRNELLSETLLKEVSSQTLRAVDEYVEKQPREIQETLGPQEKRVLALLYEKDSATFEHSIGVAKIGLEEYQEFEPDLESEGISKEAFLRACELHDAGKVLLPDCILKNTKSWKDFEHLFEVQKTRDMDFVLQRVDVSRPQETHQMPKGGKLNYYDLVSLRVLFENNEEALRECQSYGFDIDTASFMDVIRSHQEKSKEIVLALDIPDKEIIAELVGSHHPYTKHQQEDYASTKEVLRMTEVTGELLHLNDVYQAVSQERPYHRKFREVEALYFIMEQIQQGEFKEAIGKRWIHRFMQKMHEQHTPIDSQDQYRYDQLAVFSSFKANPIE